MTTSNSAPGEAEVTGLQAMNLDLSEVSILYTNAGYTGYLSEDFFKEATGYQQQSARRGNSKRPNHPAHNNLIQRFREGIEMAFS